jgi:hypothetical protein
MVPPFIGELVVEIFTEARLDSDTAGEEKRQIFHSRLAFLTFRKFIYMDPEGYTESGSLF